MSRKTGRVRIKPMLQFFLKNVWQGGKDKAVEGIHERVNYRLLARLGWRWAYKEVMLCEEGILSANLREVKKVSQCRVRQSDLERVDLVVGVGDGWIVGNDGFTPLVLIRSRNVCLRKDKQDTCEEERGQELRGRDTGRSINTSIAPAEAYNKNPTGGRDGEWGASVLRGGGQLPGE